MAACLDTSAQCTSSFGNYFVFVVFFLCVFSRTLAATYVQYSRADQLMAADYYICNKDSYNWDFIPPEIQHPPSYTELIAIYGGAGDGGTESRRGVRGVPQAKLKANPHKPASQAKPNPSLSPANTWLLKNKMDKLQLRITSHRL